MNRRMPRRLYCYKFGKEVPLLNEEEYAQVMTPMTNRTAATMDYIKTHGASLSEALENALVAQEALKTYELMTGVRLEHPDQLYAVRLSDYGRPCPNCSKLFCTPRARYCVECGHQLPEGEIAGPVPNSDQ